MSGAASAPRAIPTMYFLLYPPFKGRKSHVSTSGRKIAAFRQYLLLPGFHQPSMSPGNNWQAIARDHDWQVAYGEGDFDSREDGLNKNLYTYFFDGSTYLVKEKIHSWNCARRQPRAGALRSAAAFSGPGGSRPRYSLCR